MEDINKNTEAEQPAENQQVNQENTQQEAPKSTAIKQKIAVHKNILKRKKTPARAPLRKDVTDGSPSISSEPDTLKVTKTSVRNATKAPTETIEAASQKKQKPEKETTLQNEAETNKKTKTKDKMKIKKRKAEKAEEKVDKLKIKVKKAKKKDVKPSKLKALKEKLNNAIDKFKSRLKKLKKAKK